MLCTQGFVRKFKLQDGAPFFCAGVWEEVEDDEGQPYLSGNLITTEPKELRQVPHHRVPADWMEGGVWPV